MNTRIKINEYLKEIKPKKILDLGCGKGGILRKFLDKDCNITGVDKKNFRELLPKTINFIQEDIRDFNIKNKFDLIISSMVLHFFLKKDALKIIQKMKKNVYVGEYNFILCMSNNEQRTRENHFYPSLKELKEFYSGWNIKCEEFETDIEEHDGFPPHKHNLIILLAKKKK